MENIKSVARGAAGEEAGAATSAYETSDGITIDFHSAEFNQTDDLNDCCGNYRTFQSLEGIVTADMRHQTERRRAVDLADEMDALPVQQYERPRDETATFAPPSSLTVVSRGRTLIIASDPESAINCARLLGEQGLSCTLVITKSAETKEFPRFWEQFTLLTVDALSVTGAFGGFSAMASTGEEQQPLSAWLGDEASLFDLVLDLQTTPSFAGNRLPLGYYAPETNILTLQETLAEMPEMKGRFQRPQFLAFLKNRCFHGRSRTRECRQCLEICPYGAIQSLDRAIVIDHYRCQGCGGCALVCPAEAISLTHSRPEELLARLWRTLENRSPDFARPSSLVISDGEIAGDQTFTEREEGDQEGQAYFEVEQIGQVGVEIILAAFAAGVDRVAVACTAQNPPDIRRAAERQVQMAGAILRELGLGADKIRFAVVPPEDGETEPATSLTTGPVAPSDGPFLPSAAISSSLGKRDLVRLATQQLYARAGTGQPCISLPAGSPFGTVAVDPAACTLCMACAVACPAGALFARGEVPRLEFVESRCHQCRLCQEACPEEAISMRPRILCDPEAVETPAVLNEAEPVRCIQCGAPFASQAMINRIRGKLTGHWMYSADRQLRRLQMCRTCSTRDALVSQDVNSWNQL